MGRGGANGHDPLRDLLGAWRGGAGNFRAKGAARTLTLGVLISATT